MSSDDATAADSPPVPSSLGPYRIAKLIGKGGMGSVYLARKSGQDFDVALKVLTREHAQNPVLVQRFHSEGAAAQALDHPNIVKVYDAGEADGLLYLALEYLPGTDVQRLIERRKKLPVGRTVEIVRQVADALRHAESLGLVHRDVKPANLLISRDGTVKLTDMGLARFIDEETATDITKAGTTVGTVDYMAPEQAKSSRNADIRSDLYSLGCSWYHMLTGLPPFTEGSLMNKLVQHASAPRPDPRVHNDQVPSSVVNVLHKLMARKPKERVQSPAELLSLLDRLDAERAASSQQTSSGAEDTIAEMAAFDLENALQKAARVAGSSGSSPGMSSSKSHRTLRARTSGSVPRRKPSAERNLLPFWIGGGVGLLLLAGVLAWAFSGGGDDPQPGPVADPVVDVDPPPNPGPKPNPGPDPKPAPEPDPDPEPVIPPPTLTEDARWVRTPTERQADLPFGTEDVRAYLPEWVSEAVAGPSGLPVRTVGRVAGGQPGDFETVDEALADLPAEGVEIVLQGRGPFLVRPARVQSEGPLVIRSRDGEPATLVFPTVEEDTAHLSLESPSLTLRGIALLRASGQARGSLLAFSGPDLVLERVSLTDESSGASAASLVHSHSLQPTRTLLRDSFLKVPSRPALMVDSATCDLLVYRSGIAVGPGAAVDCRIAGTGESDSSAHLTLLGSTFLCGGDFLTLSSDADPANTPQAAILVEGNRIGTPTGVAQPSQTFMILRPWPVTNDSDPHPGRVIFRGRKNAVPGWQQWLQLSGEVVNSPLNFSRMWDESVSRSQFELARRWEGMQTPLADVTPTTLAFPGGPDFAALPIPSEADWNRIRGLTSMPQPRVGGVGTGASVVVDLDKQDLGRMVEISHRGGVTEFVARGSGPTPTSPILIESGSVRITFEKTGNTPIRLIPKPVELGRTRGRGEAMFIVTEANLELVGMNAEVLDSDRVDYPRHLAIVTDGSLTLSQCVARGPDPVKARYRSLIRWEQSVEAATSPMRPAAEPRLQIEDSLLAGSGVVLDADIADRSLIVNRSALVGGTPFKLQAVGALKPILGRVAIAHSSVAAADSLFVVTAHLLASYDEPLVQVFVTDSVLSTLPGANAVPAVVLGEKTRRESIGWWSEREFLSSALTIGDANLTGSVWSEFWGSGAVRGADVRSQNELLPDLPEKPAGVSPAQLTIGAALDSASATGQPVGAAPESLGPPEAEPQPLDMPPDAETPTLPETEEF